LSMYFVQLRIALVVEGRQFSVFFRDYGFDLGRVTMSLCADENLDRFLNTLVERDMMPRRDAWLLCVWGLFVTRFVLSSNRIVRQLVKFFVRMA